MTKQARDIGDLEIIDSTTAMNILGVGHRSNFRKFFEKYNIPHKKISVGIIFFREDVHLVAVEIDKRKQEAVKQGKNPRKISIEPGEMTFPKNINDVDFMTSVEAMKFLNINSKAHLFKLVDRYEISHKVLSLGLIFLRSEIEKMQNSPARRKNLRHGKKK